MDRRPSSLIRSLMMAFPIQVRGNQILGKFVFRTSFASNNSLSWWRIFAHETFSTFVDLKKNLAQKLRNRNRGLDCRCRKGNQGPA